MQSGDWRSRPHKPHCRKQLLGRQDQSDVSESASFRFPRNLTWSLVYGGHR